MQGLLALALIAPALALGAVHPPVLAAVLAVAAGLFFLIAFDGRYRSTVQVDLAGALLLGLAVFTALQMIPLPAGLVELISPSAHEIRAGAMRPLGVDAPGWMPLTLDVPITAMELGKLLVYAAVYFAAAAWTRRNGSDLILGLVVAAGVASAFVLLAHKILMLDQVYGFYDPVHASPHGERVSAPLINENHMAALLGLAAAVAVGMAVSARERSKRVLTILVAGLLGGALLLTLSRGGIAAFVIGQLLFIAMRVIGGALKKRRDEESRSQIAWLPLGLAISLALGLFVAQDAILGEFIGGSHKKIEMLSEGLPLIGKFPATGVGRGAFWVGFSMVSDWDASVTFTHAENAVIQILADWGVVAGGVALVGFGIIGAKRLVRPPSRARMAGAVAGLAAFGVHNLVDFNMEIPAVAILAAALLGTVCASEQEPRRRRTSSGRRLSSVSLIALGAASLLTTAVVGAYVTSRHVDVEERRLESAFAVRDAAAFSEERLGGLVSRHPASWYIPFLAGVDTFARGGDNPLPWFSRALEVNPDAAVAHLYVGRVLLRAGHMEQAKLELRLASRQRPSLAGHIARFLIDSSPSFDRISDVALDEGDRILLWGAIASQFSSRGMDEQAEIADRALLELGTPSPRSMTRHARRLCRRGDHAEALDLARSLRGIEGHGATASMLEAEVLSSRGESREANELLAAALEKDPEDRMLLKRYASSCLEVGDEEGALEAIGHLKRLSTDSRTLAAVSIFEGDLNMRSGRARAALASYRQAYALTPQDTRLLEKIADLASREGDLTRALDALRKLHAIDPSNEEWARRLEDLESDLRSTPVSERGAQ